jgi:hypothetical protein
MYGIFFSKSIYVSADISAVLKALVYDFWAIYLESRHIYTVGPLEQWLVIRTLPLLLYHLSHFGFEGRHGLVDSILVDRLFV